jgi:hypothetical protein
LFWLLFKFCVGIFFNRNSPAATAKLSQTGTELQFLIQPLLQTDPEGQKSNPRQGSSGVEAMPARDSWNLLIRVDGTRQIQCWLYSAPVQRQSVAINGVLHLHAVPDTQP